MDDPSNTSPLAQLNRKLAQLKQHLQLRSQAASALKESEDELARELERCDGLSRILEMGKSDLDKIEGPSLAGLYHSLVGDKQQRIDRQRRGTMTIEQHLVKSSMRVAHLKEQIPRLRQTVLSLDDLETEYALVLAAKSEAIARSDDARKGKLQALDEQLAHAWADIRTFEEAIELASQLATDLEHVMQSLGKAGDTGAGGHGLGGHGSAGYASAGQGAAGHGSAGNATTSHSGSTGGASSSDNANRQPQPVNASRLDETRCAVRRVMERHEKWSQLLTDAGEKGPDFSGLELFKHFCDHYFRGHIAGWAMRDKLAATIEVAVSTSMQIDQMKRHLRRRLEAAQMKSERIAGDRLRMLEQM